MKKDITYISHGLLEDAIAASGIRTDDKKGWTLVGRYGKGGPRIYVPKTKRVGRVDLVGFDGWDGPAVDLGGEKNGAVTRQLDMTGDEAAVLETFALALRHLATLPAFPPKERAARAPKAREAAAPVAAIQDRSARLALIARVAKEKGVPVSADVAAAAEAWEDDDTTTVDLPTD